MDIPTIFLGRKNDEGEEKEEKGDEHGLSVFAAAGLSRVSPLEHSMFPLRGPRDIRLIF
jgi:hypothetical protein